MRYDFDKLTERRNSACMKWDEYGESDVVPLWVADMDFEAAPEIISALQKRLDHGIFGYNTVPESYFSAVRNRFFRRHNFAIERDWIMPVPGVVPALSCVIKALAKPGDGILINSPAYNCFFSSVKNNGCHAEMSPLKAEGDSFIVDYDDFERRAAKEETTLFILCNPHNPTGRVWKEAELKTMGAICKRHNVIVVADEIHCDIVMPGYKYVPFATVWGAEGEHITLVSPSKGYNIAGLQIANIICDNPDWRRKIDRAININEVCDLNTFGIAALQAAYNEGGEWIDELCEYIYNNYLALRDFFAKEMPQLKVCRLEGTYLVWIDVSAMPVSAQELALRMLEEGRVRVNDGAMYGDNNGNQHIRINIACPRKRLIEGLRRMAETVKSICSGAAL